MMKEYMEAAEACRNLREEYEAKSKELDPLRWRLLEAQTRAESLWQRARAEAMNKAS